MSELDREAIRRQLLQDHHDAELRKLIAERETMKEALRDVKERARKQRLSVQAALRRQTNLIYLLIGMLALGTVWSVPGGKEVIVGLLSKLLGSK